MLQAPLQLKNKFLKRNSTIRPTRLIILLDIWKADSSYKQKQVWARPYGH